MGTVARLDDEIARLTEMQPRPLAKDTICRFTRHANAITRSVTIPLRSCAQRVLEVLLAHAGPEGLVWLSPEQIRDIIPRSSLREEYSLASILRSLRELHAAKLITWFRVLPNDRYPLRVGRGRASKVLMGKGPSTQSGGRVFKVNLDAFELPMQPRKSRPVAAPEPAPRVVAPVQRPEDAPDEDEAPYEPYDSEGASEEHGEDAPQDAYASPVDDEAPAAPVRLADAGQSIMHDRGGSIMRDRPSDPLRSLSETPQSLGETTFDPAPAERRTARAPAAPKADAAPPPYEQSRRAPGRAGAATPTPLRLLPGGLAPRRPGADDGKRTRKEGEHAACRSPGLEPPSRPQIERDWERMAQDYGQRSIADLFATFDEIKRGDRGPGNPWR